MTSMANGVRPTLTFAKIVRSTGWNTPAIFILGTALALLLTGCALEPPDHSKVWLSYTRWDKGCDNLANCSKLTDEAEASYYYQTLGAEDANGNPNFNLEGWKQRFGYYDATPVRAIYGNKLDLRLGRDMNCWQPQGTNQVACYVTNYGVQIPEFAVSDATAGDIHRSIGTVAMVYDPFGLGGGIAFYAFGKADDDGNQPLIRSVRLDGEGAKTVPGMCMNCHSGGDHGGLYHGTSFLPFDVQSFHFNSVLYDTIDAPDGRYYTPNGQPSPFNLDSQQEAFRKLNALVLKTNPSPAIKNLINGWYSGNVNTPGATVPDDTYIPAGWDVDKTSRNIYRHVYRKYCRTCHVAQRYNDEYKDNLAFESFEDFKNSDDEILKTMCGTHSMPNAQVPYGLTIPRGYYVEGIGFWEDGVAQSDLRDYFAGRGMGSCF